MTAIEKPAPSSSRPARGYSWRPFEVGNRAAVRSGAHSRREVDPFAETLACGLVEVRPDVARYPETVAAWARAEARCLLLAEWQVRAGLIDEATGEVRGGRYVAQFERLAADLRAKLGLDPRSEAELHRSRAEAAHATFDLDSIVTAGISALGRRDERVGDDGSPPTSSSGVRR